MRKALGKLLPGAKTAPMYAAGLGRSRADWLAGMNVTMMLTTGFGTGGKGGTLHFGRVQTPVLALVVRRERAIRTFVPKTYYELQASFELAGVASANGLAPGVDAARPGWPRCAGGDRQVRRGQGSEPAWSSRSCRGRARA
ncbi:DNA topoisomerase [Cupriavidus basilensis]